MPYKITYTATNETETADDFLGALVKVSKKFGWSHNDADQTGYWDRQDGIFYGGYDPEEDLDGQDTRFTIVDEDCSD